MFDPFLHEYIFDNCTIIDFLCNTDVNTSHTVHATNSSIRCIALPANRRGDIHVMVLSDIGVCVGIVLTRAFI